jgi:hypothetical protein
LIKRTKRGDLDIKGSVLGADISTPRLNITNKQ